MEGVIDETMGKETSRVPSILVHSGAGDGFFRCMRVPFGRVSLKIVVA